MTTEYSLKSEDDIVPSQTRAKEYFFTSFFLQVTYVLVAFLFDTEYF